MPEPLGTRAPLLWVSSISQDGEVVYIWYKTAGIAMEFFPGAPHIDEGATLTMWVGGIESQNHTSENPMSEPPFLLDSRNLKLVGLRLPGMGSSDFSFIEYTSQKGWAPSSFSNVKVSVPLLLGEGSEMIQGHLVKDGDILAEVLQIEEGESGQGRAILAG
jgi:hypothetical protein